MSLLREATIRLFCSAGLQQSTVFGSYKAFGGAGSGVQVAREVAGYLLEEAADATEEERNIAIELLAGSADRWFSSAGKYRQFLVKQAVENAKRLVAEWDGESEQPKLQLDADVAIEELGLPDKVLSVLAGSSTPLKPLTTARQLLAFGAAGLVTIKGISPTVAKKVIELASKAVGVESEEQPQPATGESE